MYWSMVKPKNGSRFAVFTERCFPIHLLFRSATTPTRRIWVGVLTITSICLFADGVDDATRDEYLQARHEAISKLMAESALIPVALRLIRRLFLGRNFFAAAPLFSAVVY